MQEDTRSTVVDDNGSVVDSTSTTTTSTATESNQSMMLVIVAIVLVVIVAIAIFLIASNNANTTTNNAVTPTPVTPTPVAPTPTAVVTTKTFTLNAQNSSGQNGTVVFTENGSTTDVTIALSSPTTTSEPAHIHLGSCPNPGTVKFPLTNVVNGTSVTNIAAKFSDLKALGAIAVNVHKSETDSGTYVSCGDLTF